MNHAAAPRLRLLFVLLCVLTSFARAAESAAEPPPDEIDRINATLEEMRISVTQVGERSAKITEQLRLSRAYLDSLVVSPTDIAGKTIDAAANGALNLSYEEWARLAEGRKDLLNQALVQDATLRENVARVNEQVKAINEELAAMRTHSTALQTQFETINKEAKNIKKSIGNSMRIAGMLKRAYGVAGEVGKVGQPLAGATTEGGAVLKRMATLFALVPAATPSPETLAKIEAEKPAAPAPLLVAGSVKMEAAPTMVEATATNPVRVVAAKPGVLGGLWEGEIEHAASGGQVKVQLCVGKPKVGQIAGFLYVAVRDEQSALYLRETKDGRWFFCDGPDEAKTARRVSLFFADQGRLGIEIAAVDNTVEFSGNLTRR